VAPQQQAGDAPQLQQPNTAQRPDPEAAPAAAAVQGATSSPPTGPSVPQAQQQQHAGASTGQGPPHAQPPPGKKQSLTTQAMNMCRHIQALDKARKPLPPATAVEALRLVNMSMEQVNEAVRTNQYTTLLHALLQRHAASAADPPPTEPPSTQNESQKRTAHDMGGGQAGPSQAGPSTAGPPTSTGALTPSPPGTQAATAAAPAPGATQAEPGTGSPARKKGKGSAR